MKLIFTIFLLSAYNCFAQENTNRGTIKIEKTTCVLLDNSDSVYASVDKMPEFPGGQDSLMAWIRKSINYPSPSYDERNSATVFCSFVVKPDGKLTEIKILKGAYVEYDKEVLRLLYIMPDWNPGKCKDVPVYVKINYPISFKLK